MVEPVLVQKSKWAMLMPMCILFWGITMLLNTNTTGNFVFFAFALIFGVGVYTYTGLQDNQTIEWTENALSIQQKHCVDDKNKITKHFMSKKTKDTNWNHSFVLKAIERHITFRIDKNGKIDGITSTRIRDDYDEELNILKSKRNEIVDETITTIDDLQEKFKTEHQNILAHYESPLDKELRINKENSKMAIIDISEREQEKVDKIDELIKELEESKNTVEVS